MMETEQRIWINDAQRFVIAKFGFAAMECGRCSCCTASCSGLKNPGLGPGISRNLRGLSSSQGQCEEYCRHEDGTHFCGLDHWSLSGDYRINGVGGIFEFVFLNAGGVYGGKILNRF
jgi:hypothetical protein